MVASAAERLIISLTGCNPAGMGVVGTKYARLPDSAAAGFAQATQSNMAMK
jgi:hypothetical protein